MATENQIRANRANAAKSRGPKTPAGIARSSQNARKHGLHAFAVLAAGEDDTAFHASLDSYAARFQPADDVEAHLVEDLAVAAWKRRRYWKLEAALFDGTRCRMMNSNDPQIYSMTNRQLDAHILRELADDSKSLVVVNRFQSSHERAYRRSLQALQTLQSARKNEPNLTTVPAPAAAPPRPVSRALSAKHVAAAQVRHAASTK